MSQTIPPPFSTQGAVPTIAQWETAWSDKSDARILSSDVGVLYVAATGNDTTGDGSSGKPWATLQRAADYCSNNLYINSEIDINIGVGTFAGCTFSGLSGMGDYSSNGVWFVGSGIDQTIITDRIGVSNTGSIVVGHYGAAGQGMTFNSNSAFVGYNSTMDVEGPLAFAPTSIYSYFIYADKCLVTSSGAIEVRQSGLNGGTFATAYNYSYYYSSAHVTLTGTPNTFTPFMDVEDYSHHNNTGSFTGTANGIRFVLIKGASLNSNGGGINKFPGSLPGTWDGSSYYDLVLGSPAAFSNLQNAINDSTAAGLGVQIGQIYRNGSILMIRVA